MTDTTLTPSRKRLRRRAFGSLDRLSACDALLRSAGMIALTRFHNIDPVVFADYYTRKRRLIRASVFLQRYGRDFYARGAA